MRAIFLVPLLAACGSAQSPDPADLVRKSIAAEKANGPRLRQYAYREYIVNRDFDKNGKETSRKTQTWETIGLEGSSYRKLVMRDDKPLQAKEQKREDDRQQKEAERRRKETPEQRRNRTLSFSYSFAFPFPKSPEIYDLRYAGEETINGRRAHMVEGTAKSTFQPATADEKEALNYKMKVWIDNDDQCLSRIDLEVIGDHSRMQKGSAISFISSRNEEGVWLPKELSFRFSVRFFKVVGGRGEHVATYSDFHKFQVDSRIVGP